MSGWGAIAGQALGMVTNRVQDDRSEDITRDMMELQSRYNEDAAERNQTRNKEMWRYTNYTNQIKEMKKAGVGMGMLYGGSGAGGTSTAGAQAAPVSQGQFKTENTGMGMSEVANAMADIKLKEAQAENLDANTEKLKGVDTDKTKAEIADLSQGVENKKAQEKLTEAQEYLTKIQGFNEKEMSEDKINEVMWNAQKAWAVTKTALNDAWISDKTMEDKAAIIAGEAAAVSLGNQLTQAQITQVRQSIKNSIAEIHLKKGSQDIEWWKAQVQKNLAEAGLNLAQQKIVIDAIGAVIK